MARELTTTEQQRLSQSITDNLPRVSQNLINGFVIVICNDEGYQTISNMPEEDQEVLLKEVVKNIQEQSHTDEGCYHPPSQN